MAVDTARTAQLPILRAAPVRLSAQVFHLLRFYRQETPTAPREFFLSVVCTSRCAHLYQSRHMQRHTKPSGDTPKLNKLNLLKQITLIKDLATIICVYFNIPMGQITRVNNCAAITQSKVCSYDDGVVFHISLAIRFGITLCDLA